METAKLPLDILQKVERRWSEQLARASSHAAPELKAAHANDTDAERLVPTGETVDPIRNRAH